MKMKKRIKIMSHIRLDEEQGRRQDQVENSELIAFGVYMVGLIGVIIWAGYSLITFLL